MACAGCGAKYRSINNLNNRRRLAVPAKSIGQLTPSKKTTVPASPRKVNPEIAVGLLANLANSMPR